MDDFSHTLVDILYWRSANQPEQSAYTFLLDGEATEVALTYKALYEKSHVLARRLLKVAAPGDRALLLYPHGLDYIIAFFACLSAGVIAVPAYPPRFKGSINRLQTILSDAQASVVLTDMKTASLESMQALVDQAGLHILTTDINEPLKAERWQSPHLEHNDIAFFQYTSGSTGLPKGVIVTHDNLMHNLRMMQKIFEVTQDTVIVSWLPLYHDMGLIGNILQPLYAGVPAILMSPLHFVQRPLRWLQAISRYKATISGAPNFAYDLCTRKITDEQKALLDLRSWRVAYNGSEPILSTTLHNFSAAFQSCGFRFEHFQPCYGLAEATLVVTGNKRSETPILCTVDSSALRDGQIVNSMSTDAGSPSQEIVSCGGRVDQRLAIVDKEGKELAEGQIGEIWIAGPSVARGYWNQPEETEHIFRARLEQEDEGPFLRTGDLGFVKDGELFITGRSKDVIIIRGRNHYPQDIEHTVEQAYVALQPHGGAAFSIEVDHEERLVIVQEVERGQKEHIEEVIEAIRQKVAENHEVQVYAVVLVKRGGIPKTSSGKIQRHLCKAQYLSGTLDAITSNIIETAQLLDDMDTTDTAPAITQEILRALKPAQRQQVVEAFVQEQLAVSLGRPQASLARKQSLHGLGLDSLKSVELHHKIEETLQIPLSPSLFLQGLSIAEIAARILTAIDCASPTSSVRLASSAEQAQEAPLSYGQQAMWFLYQLTPQSPALNIFITLPIHSAVDVAALRRTFEKLQARHEILRTTYLVREGQPVQRIHASLESNFQEIDLSGRGEKNLQAMLQQEADHPFCLEQEAPLRVKLFTCAPEEHILALTLHHIAVDLWSVEILIDELRLFYSHEKEGIAVSLARPGLRYVDFVRFQSDLVHSPASTEHIKYWQKQLQGHITTLNLPADRLPPPMNTYNGASYPFDVDKHLTLQLKELSASAGTTPYMTLLTAFQVLLYRYTGADDIRIGSPVSGRSRLQLSDLVGLLINHIVICASCSHHPSFRDLLQQTYHRVLEALEHQDYPFPLLAEQLQNLTHQLPLFQVAFVWGQAHRLEEREVSRSSPFTLDDTGLRLNWGGLITEPIAIEQRGAPFGITLTIYERSASLSASIQYNSDLFSRDMIASMADTLLILLQSIVDDPDARISTLPLLRREEQLSLIQTHGERKDANDQTIHGLFEACVQAHPDACALTFQGQQVRYRELNAQSNRIAHGIRRLGVPAGQVVVIMLEYSPLQIAAFLAVLKTGCAFLCLDTTYPSQRLNDILQDAEAAVLLTDSTCMQKLRELLREDVQKYSHQLVIMDASEYEMRQWRGKHTYCGSELFTNCPETNISEPVNPEAAAYIAYTSGSTGKAKGIVQTHRSFCQFLLWQSKQFGIHSTKRFAQWATLTYDASYCEIFGALCFGATLCMNQPAVKHDPSAVIDWVREERISLLQVIPSFCQQMLWNIEHGPLRTENNPFPHLEVVLLSGEVLSVEFARAWLMRFPHGPVLYNLYGPTESVLATYHAIQQEDIQQRSITIGQAIDGRQIVILDKERQPCPPGIEGEIYIRSHYLTAGYYRLPEETQKSFMQNPLHNDYPDPVYRTGDLGRWLANGTIEFRGRIDNQVKIRGMRVELEEIEAALSLQRSVKECAVNVYSYGAQKAQQTLVAYVVVRENTSASELRSFLQEKLPKHMVPTLFLFLDVLPRTSNGKLDRHLLPEPGRHLLRERENYIAPRTMQEKRIAQMWQELLFVDKVGLYDNFFDLGGHSLLAMQAVNRLQEVFGIKLSMRTFFEKPTSIELAKVVEAANEAEQKNVEKIFRIIERIQQLTDQEVIALLQEKGISPR